MNLLALETATESCSVALRCQREDGYDLVVRRLHAPRQQTELILPMVDEVLAEAGMTLSQVDALAYSAGPGAFTGVRIGAAVAQGLAFGIDVGIIAVSSLQTLAQGAWRAYGARAAVAAFDARMQEIYIGAFALDADNLMQAVHAEVAGRPEALPAAFVQAWQAVLEHLAVSAEEAVSVAAGSGWQTYAEVLSAKLAVVRHAYELAPDAEDVANLAWARALAGQAQAPEFALPVYLRNDVWKKLPGR